MRGAGPIFRFFAILTLLLVPALRAPLAQDSPSQQQVDQFVRFLHSETYTVLLARKALDTDRQMPPNCGERQLLGRQLFAVTLQPRFIESREVPVEGEWAERVTVERCGQTVEHNVYFYASRVRGLHAVAGFPGRTLVQPELQAEVGQALLRRGREIAPQCSTFDIVGVAIDQRPATSEDAWSESWTLYMCGNTRAVGVRFDPAPEGETRFTLLD